MVDIVDQFVLIRLSRLQKDTTKTEEKKYIFLIVRE